MRVENRPGCCCPRSKQRASHVGVRFRSKGASVMRPSCSRLCEKGDLAGFSDDNAMNAVDGERALAVLNPLFRGLEMLGFVARHVHPPDFESLMASIGTPETDLKAVMQDLREWPQNLADCKGPIVAASEATLEAFEALRAVLEDEGDVRSVYRALRLLPKGLAALYPLAGVLPQVNLFYLDPAFRSENGLQELLLRSAGRENTGVMRFDARDGERGGYWLYVPEYYDPGRVMPLVVALHGGSGTGRQFLWSWLRDARSRGVILVAPTSVGGTWALMGTDPDTPNLARILEVVRSKWSVDPRRLMLTGMSDGGTFTYVTGLEAGSPFTHLAPVSAAFHPMLAQLADAGRTHGLPIHIVHGALDWMFPVELAREAHRTLARAGALVTYCEIEDLSHTYAREENAALLRWLDAAPGKGVST
jgi:phospholipase/carboxylesterase